MNKSTRFSTSINTSGTNCEAANAVQFLLLLNNYSPMAK